MAERARTACTVLIPTLYVPDEQSVETRPVIRSFLESLCVGCEQTLRKAKVSTRQVNLVRDRRCQGYRWVSERLFADLVAKIDEHNAGAILVSLDTRIEEIPNPAQVVALIEMLAERDLYVDLLHAECDMEKPVGVIRLSEEDSETLFAVRRVLVYGEDGITF